MRQLRWLLPLVILLFFSQLSPAQTNEWAVMKQLLPNQKVKIKAADGKSHVGKVVSVTDDAVQIGKDQPIQKQDVEQVFLWSAGHHARNALIGLGAGAGTGVVIGAASCGGKGAWFGRGQCIAVAAPLLGGLGAGLGALVPSSGKWREVYRSR